LLLLILARLFARLLIFGALLFALFGLSLHELLLLLLLHHLGDQVLLVLAIIVLLLLELNELSNLLLREVLLV
jgi:hypothetical protein